MKRLLNFSECCEWCHSPSIFVSIRKSLLTLVRHSEAFATFVRHLQGVCNLRRFPFLSNHVLPLLPMIYIDLNNEPKWHRNRFFFSLNGNLLIICPLTLLWHSLIKSLSVWNKEPSNANVFLFPNSLHIYYTNRSLVIKYSSFYFQIHSIFIIPIAASSSNIRIIRKKMAKQWQRW